MKFGRRRCRLHRSAWVGGCGLGAVEDPGGSPRLSLYSSRLHCGQASGAASLNAVDIVRSLSFPNPQPPHHTFSSPGAWGFCARCRSTPTSCRLQLLPNGPMKNLSDLVRSLCSYPVSTTEALRFRTLVEILALLESCSSVLYVFFSVSPLHAPTSQANVSHPTHVLGSTNYRPSIHPAVLALHLPVCRCRRSRPCSVLARLAEDLASAALMQSLCAAIEDGQYSSYLACRVLLHFAVSPHMREFIGMSLAHPCALFGPEMHCTSGTTDGLTAHSRGLEIVFGCRRKEQPIQLPAA